MTPITPGARGPGVGTNPAYMRVTASLQDLKGEQGASQDLRWAVQGGRANGAQGAAGAFPAGRYFTIAGLGAFGLAALVMLWQEREQGLFFRQVQDEQRAFVGKMQDEVARRDLLSAHESGNINLARPFGALFAIRRRSRTAAPRAGRRTRARAAAACPAGENGLARPDGSVAHQINPPFTFWLPLTGAQVLPKAA